MNRAPALAASVLLHAGLLGAFLFWPDRAEPPKPPPVPVKLVPPPPTTDGPAEITTAPEPSPEPSPEPPAAEPEPAPAEPAPPTPNPPTPQPPRPTPPPSRPAPRPTPQPTPPRPTPPQRPAPRVTPPRPAPPSRPAEPSLDLSELGQRLARNQPAKPAGATPGQLAAARSELRQRLQRLWRPNCGPDDALAVNVRVRFRLRDGRIQGTPELIGGASDDVVVRAAQERALAAVRAAAPFDWLPEELQTETYDPITFNAEQACR